MRAIFGYVREYLAEDFHPGHFVFVGLLLTGLIWFNYNYYEAKTFTEYLLLDADNRFELTLYYLLLYLIPGLLVLASRALFYADTKFLITPLFWVAFLGALLALSLDTSLMIRRFEVFRAYEFIHSAPGLWLRMCANNFLEFIILFLPGLLFWFFVTRKESGEELYGFRFRGVNLRPYFLMLVFMAPFIAWASFQPDFLQTYPRFTDTAAGNHLGIAPAYTFFIFELFYGLAFVSVEFFFRGYFTIGLARYLGKGVIPLMAVIYCMIHFQKPMVEAVSSIFGGALLGIIALNTRSIYGGIIAHLGVAWMMEIAAFTQMYYDK